MEPTQRDADTRSAKVASEAAPQTGEIDSKTAWEQHRLGEAASLTAGINWDEFRSAQEGVAHILAA
jgi:hypothetical protein